MYKNLEIENFRSIKHLSIEDLGRINVLLGKNNSSKTTVLETLFLLFGATNPALIVKAHEFRNFFFNEASDLRFIFRDLDFKNKIKIKLLSEDKNDFREVTILPSSDSSDTKTKRVEVDVKNIAYDSTRKEDEINELMINGTVKKRNSKKKETKSLLIFNKTDNSFNFTPSPEYSDHINAVFLPPKIPLSTNLAKELEHLIINKQHDDLISMLQTVDPKITGISFGTNQIIYVDVGINQLVPINLSGDGIRRYLSLLLALYNSKGGIVLIDEIENGLHFSTLIHLWDDLIRLSQELDVQLFITTHNIDTLCSLKLALEKENNKDFQQQVRAYTLKNIKGEHKSYKYDFESFEHAIDYEIELR